jgi:hypothetical protein
MMLAGVERPDLGPLKRPSRYIYFSEAYKLLVRRIG